MSCLPQQSTVLRCETCSSSAQLCVGSWWQEEGLCRLAPPEGFQIFVSCSAQSVSKHNAMFCPIAYNAQAVTSCSQSSCFNDLDWQLRSKLQSHLWVMQLSATKVWKFPKNKYKQKTDVRYVTYGTCLQSLMTMPEERHICGLSTNQASWHHVSCDCVFRSTACTVQHAPPQVVLQYLDCAPAHPPMVAEPLPALLYARSAQIHLYTPLHNIVTCQRQAWQLCYMPCCTQLLLSRQHHTFSCRDPCE